MPNDRVFNMSFAGVYPHYVAKAGLAKKIEKRTSMRDFYEKAPKWNPNASLITGVVCGIRVENIEDPLMQKIRYLDKLVDELAKGKKMEKILRNPE